MDITSRRRFLTGLTGFVACAPAIVQASSLMAVKPYDRALAFLNMQIALGFTITAEALARNLYRSSPFNSKSGLTALVDISPPPCPSHGDILPLPLWGR